MIEDQKHRESLGCLDYLFIYLLSLPTAVFLGLATIEVVSPSTFGGLEFEPFTIGSAILGGYLIAHLSPGEVDPDPLI